MPVYDFDTLIDRRQSNAVKWSLYEDDVLPMWIADMDFRAPQPVIDALHTRIDHGVFGYHKDEPQLNALLVERLAARHNLSVTPQQVVFLPGLVLGLNVVSTLIGAPGDGVLTMTPIYPPFISAPNNHGRVLQTASLAVTRTGSRLDTEIDFDAMEAAVTPQTRLFLLCSPHNPTGRVWRRAELEQIAEFCLRHDLIIASDEIHCDLVYPGAEHISIASLSPEVSDRTITLLAPSKTYNIPGIYLSAAVSTNNDLIKRVQNWQYGMGTFVNTLGYAAALAAYRDGGEWLSQAMSYLQANRDLVVETIARDLPMLATTVPEATYLAWIDCRELLLSDHPNHAACFLDFGRVAFNDGAAFGTDGAGFVRLNFGAPRASVIDGLNRMKRACDRLTASGS